MTYDTTPEQVRATEEAHRLMAQRRADRSQLRRLEVLVARFVYYRPETGTFHPILAAKPMTDRELENAISCVPKRSRPDAEVHDDS